MRSPGKVLQSHWRVSQPTQSAIRSRSPSSVLNIPDVWRRESTSEPKETQWHGVSNHGLESNSCSRRASDRHADCLALDWAISDGISEWISVSRRQQQAEG